MMSSLPTLEEEIARENYAPDGEKIYWMKKRDIPKCQKEFKPYFILGQNN